MEYNSPSIIIIKFDSKRILCASLGETQDYESENFWGVGDEN